MIEGIKVTVGGTEMKMLCEQAAQNHKSRADAYALQLDQMEKNQIEGMQYSGGDPKKAIKDKANEHVALADELEFIASHIDVSEVYLLDRQDLLKLGIAKQRWY